MTDLIPQEAPDSSVPKAIRQGVLLIADFEFRCYVLDTASNDRVLSRQDLMKALGMHANPPNRHTENPNDNIPAFLRAANLRPFITSDLIDSTTPIHFTNLKWHKTIGYKADILKDICYVFIDAAKAGVLTAKQVHIAERCEALVRGFSSVGLRALVDEVTGFQDLKPRDDLQRYLDAFLLKEQAKWTKRFPDEFFQLLFEMMGWQWDELTSKKPSYIGKMINNLVYERLGPKILDELRARNPPNESGRRKAKFHQFLTENIGHPKLQEHLSVLIAFLKVARGNPSTFRRTFESMVDVAAPRFGHTIPLQFPDNEPKQLPPVKPTNAFDAALKGLLDIPPPPKLEKRKKPKPPKDDEADGESAAELVPA